MIIKIFYFSGTGNTWWVSEKLKENLQKDNSVSIYPIERFTEKDISDLLSTDWIIIGYPIYGSDMPFIVYDFINKLPILKRKIRTSIFCTQLMFSGNGASFYRKKLEQKGYQVKTSFHVNMPNNIPNLTNYKKERIEKYLCNAQKTINKACDAIRKDIIRIRGGNPMGWFLGILQRPLYRAGFNKQRNTMLSIDYEKCVKCLRCVQICPSENIHFSDNGIKFKESCIWCTRCINFCPKRAIRLLGKTPYKNQYRGPSDFDPALIAKNRNLSDFID